MELKSTRDKAIFRPEDMQTLVKDYVLKRTGRKVHGEVQFAPNGSAMCELEAAPGIIEPPSFHHLGGKNA